jgi:uncharacterized membrane protein
LIIVINVLLGAMFLARGATPVPLFLAAGVAAVAAAFGASYRQAWRTERVQVSADQVRVTRERGAHAQTIWTSPTAFTRVALDEDDRYGAQVRLMLSGRRLVIGQVLGPKERARLAESLQEAIRSARAERYE